MALEFLKSLDEVEKAFFAKYKVPTYLPATTEKLISALRLMNFDFNTLEEVIRANEFINHSPNHCKRCGSSKFMQLDLEIFQEKHYFDPLAHQSNIEKIKMPQCLVCGYDNFNHNRKKNFILKQNSF